MVAPIQPQSADAISKGIAPPTNTQVSESLNEIADLLEAQAANPFRIRAYRIAAATIEELESPLHQVLDEEGLDGLIRLPGIGRSIASAIEHFCATGHMAMLDRLRGELAAERVFTTVPGIGPELAARIHDELGIETLAQLETAAYDGTLAKVAGMGRKRILAVQQSCAGRFRAPRSRASQSMLDESQLVPVADLLAIDEKYRRLAQQDRLIRIAPKRFNPEGKAWLPILHTQQNDGHYTALFSNTAKAHEFGKTHDWVVIYRDDHDGDGQWTVITSQFGKLKGKRIVRGREKDCAEHYLQASPREKQM